MASSLRVQPHQSLKSFNTFGIDVSAAWFLEVETIGQLQEVIADPARKSMPKLVLGGGSNILFTQDYPGLVLKMAITGKRLVQEDSAAVYVEAMAGESWHGLVQWTLAQGWDGLENLSLIPGTVGAAPIQNIGAYGVELKDYVDELLAIDLRTGEFRRFSLDDCQFAYRDSIFKRTLKDRYAIVSVTFRLPRVPSHCTGYGELQAELTAMGVTTLSGQAISEAICAIRRRKLPDPAVIGNAGSFFKNPVVSTRQANALKAAHPGMVTYSQGDGTAKLGAGWLIDQCGWKGKTQGRAGVYSRQALVLINCGGATGAEIESLADSIRESVMDKFGIRLEAEPVTL